VTIISITAELCKGFIICDDPLRGFVNNSIDGCLLFLRYHKNPNATATIATSDTKTATMTPPLSLLFVLSFDVVVVTVVSWLVSWPAPELVELVELVVCISLDGIAEIRLLT